jgi:hypothetical protein
MNESITIPKHTAMNPSQDYAWLRKKGLAYIEQLGSKLWTDYNIHDPGITLLELLAYAITDLGYRTSFTMQDLLAVPVNKIPDHKRQGFYTAREIFTVNPLTIRDYRKLLIDVNGVKNAWLQVRQSACEDIMLYTNCVESALQYSPATEHSVMIKGLYDVLLEFEDDERMGNLNSGKILYRFNYKNHEGEYTAALVEMRLPSWAQINSSNTLFGDFRLPESKVKSVTVNFISGNKTDNEDVHLNDQANALRRTVFATLTVNFRKDRDDEASEKTLVLNDVPLRVWFKSDDDRKVMKLDDLKKAIGDASVSGILSKYHSLIAKADQVVAQAKNVLHQHRNLCEDFCSIRAVAVEDIAVCTDIEVEPGADIEAVLAEAYFQIDHYFSPDIKFYSLKQLLDKGTAVEDIFDGPALHNGFIDNAQIDSTALRRVLYTSDIINLLMDIPGVLSIKNFSLVKYDAEGRQTGNVEPWQMHVSPQHQPRFYMEASKFLVFKNGLLFLPDRSELHDVLQVTRIRNQSPQYSIFDNDLPVPAGIFYPLEDYHPVQYQLPLTYGVGYEGLPGNASIQRKAQAKQLKAFLLFFEQMLVNYLAQLAHVADHFAIDENVDRTYFTRCITNDMIHDIERDLYGAETEDDLAQFKYKLQTLAELPEEFLDRRNRVLDHQLARFAENFTDYALMLYNYTDNRKVASEQLIIDKINFLRDVTLASRNRGKAFNYTVPAESCGGSHVNTAGLKIRIMRLLGMQDAHHYFQWHTESDNKNNPSALGWKLADESEIYLVSNVHRSTTSEHNDADENYNSILKFISRPDHYQIKKGKKWMLNLLDDNGNVIATGKRLFSKKTEAEEAQQKAIEFGKKIIDQGRIYIVEHLLFRPRNGSHDDLLPICITNCPRCGEDDPYSFRMTIVLSGEGGLFNNSIDMRRFAEKTIRQEVPAHISVKICWVSNDQLQEFGEKYCHWLQELTNATSDSDTRTEKLNAAIAVFKTLKSVYPPASLHDCIDGNDANRVYLNQTIITSKPKKSEI